MNRQEIVAIAIKFVNAMDKVIEENKARYLDILRNYPITNDVIRVALLGKYLNDNGIEYFHIIFDGQHLKDDEYFTRVWIQLDTGVILEINPYDVVLDSRNQKVLSGAYLTNLQDILSSPHHTRDYSELNKLIESPFLTMDELFNMIISYIE